MIQKENGSAALSSFYGAHESCRACSNDDNICVHNLFQYRLNSFIQQIKRLQTRQGFDRLTKHSFQVSIKAFD
jgi:hypothetical protein